ncbi:MAG: GNAT family N-acetyltransferase [Planctomycetota bacterium]
MGFPSAEQLRIRPAEDTDSPGIVALVGLCFAEYPGCVLDVDREEPGLLTPTTSFARFWVLAAENDRIFGCIACTEHDVEGRPGVELKKCYLHPAYRGRGLASRLVALVEQHAWAADRPRVELWSDTRFEQAHAVYAHLGYRRTGTERDLQDLSATREFHFLKELTP